MVLQWVHKDSEFGAHTRGTIRSTLDIVVVGHMYFMRQHGITGSRWILGPDYLTGSGLLV